MRTKNSSFTIFILKILMAIFAFSSNYLAQETSDYFKMNGSASLSNDFYSSSGIERRRPANVSKIILRANALLFNQIQLPFELYLTTEESRFQQPFNQFGVSPIITDWLTIHAGYFSSRISDFSFGDMRLLGGGAEITPGNFRFKIFAGRSKKGIDADTANYIPAVYKQNAFAASIGYGNEGDNFVNLNFFRAIDDINSIKPDSSNPAGNENTVASLSFGLQPSKAISFKGEIGVSAFSSDILSRELDKLNFPGLIFTPRISSSLDGAAKLSISFSPEHNWGIRTLAQWIGPGFQSLGYAQTMNDIMEFSFSPYARFLENRLNLRAQVGIRYNNLRNNRIAVTNRFTGSFGVNWQVSQEFGFDAQYNNNQIQSSHINDTLKISNIFNSISLSPRYAFQWLEANNTASINYSFQKSSDNNSLTSQTVKSETHSISAMHTLIFPSTWSFTTSVIYNSSDFGIISSQIINLTETIGKQFFENKLSSSVSFGINYVKTTVDDNQFLIRLTASYNLNKWGTVSFNLSNNTYNGTHPLTPNYNELYGGLQYNIGF